MSRRERTLVAAAVVAGVAARVAYVLATRHYRLAGDEIEYDLEGRFIAAGHWFWTERPYGIAHAGAWKAPGYPAWVGLWYAVLGHHLVAVRLVQVPLGAVTIVLTHRLARRRFGSRVAIVAAYVVALYPLAFQYEELLYSESLATPLTLATLLAILGGRPSRRRALVTGLLLGLTLLVRSSSVLLLAGALAAWWGTLGARRGVAYTALAAVAAAVVVAPWTIRNAIVLHGFLPVSIEDAAGYGTFNAQAARDPTWPYAWRPHPPDLTPVLQRRPPLGDVAFHTALQHLAEHYVEHHPLAVPEAFFWNGLSRLWDVRRRARSLAEVPFEGRSRLMTEVGLDAYDVLLPLALLGLWRIRRRRELVAAMLATALAASIVFTSDSGTRYRATLEPVIAILACAGALGVAPDTVARQWPRER